MTLDSGSLHDLSYDRRQSDHEVRNVLQWLRVCAPHMRAIGHATLEAIYTEGAVRSGRRTRTLERGLIANLGSEERLFDSNDDVCIATVGTRERGDDALQVLPDDRIDETIVLQVVLNLEQNARRHGGGHLFTHLERAVFPGGTYLTIAVGDRNCGTRSERAESERGGEGLGLRVVRELLALHEGWLTYMTRSAYERSRGASAQVLGHVAVAAVRVGGALQGPARRRVLCVDDNRLAREAVGVVLGREGYVVDLVATSAVAAVEARRHYYSHAFIDARLGDGDGLNLATEIAPLVGDVTILSGDEPPMDWQGTWLQKPAGAHRLVDALVAQSTAALDNVGAVCHLLAVARSSSDRTDVARYLHTLARHYAWNDLAAAAQRLMNEDGAATDIAVADIERCLRWHIHRAGERKLTTINSPAQ